MAAQPDTPVTLREFDFDRDYDAVIALWQAAGPGVHLGRSDQPDEIRKKLTRDPDLFLVAEAGGELVGTVLGGFDGRRGLIYHLAVAESHRGQGLGLRLMEAVERRLAQKGCLRSYLLVTGDNEGVIPFYERHGWETMDLHLLAKNLA